MKKWLIALVLISFLLAAGFYFSIPDTIPISSTAFIKANPDASYRLLMNRNQWQKWWPMKQADGNYDSLSYNGIKYQVNQKQFQSFKVRISDNGKLLNSQLLLLPLGTDSLAIEWRTNFPTDKSLFTKLSQFKKSHALRKDMFAILSSLKSFLEKNENLYSTQIEETQVKDSVILVTNTITDHYPSPEEVYIMVNLLKNYIHNESSHETNYPMLNVDSSNGRFRTMVGIPVDKIPPVPNNNIVIKRMVLGKILVTEVRGGPYTIKKALQQLDQYMTDYKRKSPAIPYESLITNRLKESDTSKWVTKLYYPVF